VPAFRAAEMIKTKVIIFIAFPMIFGASTLPSMFGFSKQATAETKLGH
jgi:hypothetical protein